MTPRRLSDAALLASIAEATAAWNAPQDTEYYAEKHRLDHGTLHKRLIALEASGKVTRRKGRAFGYPHDYWGVVT